MIIKNWKKELFTIPNLLSIFRVVLIPVYIAMYLRGEYFASAGVLAVSCLTDLVDGRIARKYNMITAVGKILDPLADKLTQFALILCLSFKHPILRWLIGCFAVKEGFQLIAGSINLKKGIMLKGALFSGKLCTTVMFISLIIMVLIPNLTDPVLMMITGVDIVFMVISFVDYCITYARRDNKFQSIDVANG